ncbi:MAG: hypothetical protein K2P68_06125 [Sphingomonas sp.]|nr:hypothetical protein [Sphingomonas sp.]
MIYGWSPGIGDPTIWGWVTVANYFLAFISTAWAARKDWSNQYFWSIISIFMLALCINKQLDLQSLLTAVAREIARRGNWYQDRRIFQREFIELVIILSVSVIGLLIFLNRKAKIAVLGTITGTLFIAGFVVARAASFHHMDQALGISIFAFKLNHILENFGIMIVLISSASVNWPRRRLPQ